MRKVIAVLLAIAVLVTFAGCSAGSNGIKNDTTTPATDSSGAGKEAASNSQASEEVSGTIKLMSYWVGTNSQAPYLKYMLGEFDKQYPKIKVQLEEVPGAGQELDDKLKVLISASDFPDVTVCKTYATVEVAAKAKLLVDLKPYIEAKSEWSQSISDEINKGFNPVDGKWYAIVSSARMFSYFYNKHMFETAGVKAVPETWDEMWQAADKLKAAGYTPFALQGSDGGWLVNTWLMPILGTMNEAGFKMASTRFPESFKTPEFIKAAEIMKKMFQQYASDDMIGNVFSASAATFLQEQSAMIAQTPSLIDSMNNPEMAKEGLVDRVGIALFPGKANIAQLGDAWVCGSKDENALKASLVFLEFMTNKKAQSKALEMASSAPVDTSIDPSSLNLHPLLKELLTIEKEAAVTVESPHMFFSSALWPTINSQYSALVFDEITPEDLARILTEDSDKLVHNK